jgi:hypothetical protein
MCLARNRHTLAALERPRGGIFIGLEIRLGCGRSSMHVHFAIAVAARPVGASFVSYHVSSEWPATPVRCYVTRALPVVVRSPAYCDAARGSPQGINGNRMVGRGYGAK